MADLTTVNPLFLALFANADGTGELGGNGYQRLQITNDNTVFSVDGSGNRLSIVPLQTSTATGDWGLIRSVGFFDTSSGGTVLAWKAIAPLFVATNQAVAFPAGALGYTSGSNGQINVANPGLTNIPRSLYLYANRGIEALSILARSLYTYENRGIEALSILARSLYTYENRGIEALSVLARSLYLYEATRDGEVAPWLMKIDPNEQVRGGQVSLYGDGLGEIVEVASDATITASSTSGANVPGNTVDRGSAEWVSTSGASAWIRFTFSGARTIVGVALEDRNDTGNRWGVPLFRFSDGGPDVVGDADVPLPVSTTEYPVGMARQFYTFAPRTVTWVEVRVASGGLGTNRGLREVWVYEDRDAAAETSRAILNRGRPNETVMGIVTWSNRSPGLWPANGGQPITPAAIVTVPADAESGLVVVEEST
jgi:hypothetical protein